MDTMMGQPDHQTQNPNRQSIKHTMHVFLGELRQELDDLREILHQAEVDEPLPVMPPHPEADAEPERPARHAQSAVEDTQDVDANDRLEFLKQSLAKKLESVANSEEDARHRTIGYRKS